MNIEQFNNPVAINIIRLIDEKGLKQKSIAEKAGYSTNDFNAMLNGRRLIKISDIKPIAMALNVPVNELYREEEGTSDNRQ